MARNKITGKRWVGAGVALTGLLAASLAVAQGSEVLSVTFQGPGGHSNGNYGRTSSVHAASRAIANMAATMDPASYVVSGFGGGNSVNSVASDAHFKVRLKSGEAAGKAAVEAAVKSGVQAENDFRGVKTGDLTGNVPATIRYTIKP